MLFLLGPLMWVVSLLVVAYVIGHDTAIGIALLALTASLAIALVLVGWTRIARAREERAA